MLLGTRLAAAHQPAQPRCAAPAESSRTSPSGKPRPYRWAEGTWAGVLGAQAWVDIPLYRLWECSRPEHVYSPLG